MKTVLVALNSKYIHSSLAPWYLKSYCGDECGEIEVLEFTINQSLDVVIASIYEKKPDVVAFSCYVWNVTEVLRTGQSMKKILKHAKIVLGGPEVSFAGKRIMKDNPFIDYVIQGEGEKPLKSLLKKLFDNNKVFYVSEYSGDYRINGLVYRNGDKIESSGIADTIEELDLIPTPYTDEMLNRLNGKIVYFESSRGCPFSCSYCLSSISHGVRYFSMNRVKSDLFTLINAEVSQIKFVDRTFNCSKKRTKEIFRFVIEHGRDINFHFEAAADLFDDDILDMLSQAPRGRIQFEIGIQTTNTESLEAVDRKTDLEKLFRNVDKLVKMGNIHVHVDLIAGLPFEDISSFRRSFNEAYNLKTHQLQLGFLKLLNGTKIRKQTQKFEYRFKGYPPYEVLLNKYMSFGDIIKLKGIEDIVERYHNSGRFRKSLTWLVERSFCSAFDFFSSFYLFNLKEGNTNRSISARECYEILFKFIKLTVDKRELLLLNDLLKVDYLSTNNTVSLPKCLCRKTLPNFREWCFEFLKSEDNISTYLPEFVGVPAKQIYKKVHFEAFDYQVTDQNICNGFKEKKTVVLFNYNSIDKVTGLYQFSSVYYC